MTGQANIAHALSRMASNRPDAIAIHAPVDKPPGEYASYTYRQLDDDSSTLARGLIASGIAPGSRAALLVPPSYELFALTFALFKAGIPPVIVDPGIGTSALGACLGEAEPKAFIGVTKAQMGRVLLGWARASVEHVVTVGPRLFWGGTTLKTLREKGAAAQAIPLPDQKPEDVAAVLFTSGSTGLPKGVVYTHAMFAAQVDIIQQTYGIQPGEVDLPTFPLFALFDPALGMTTVLPRMDPTQPGQVDPRNILDPIARFHVTNMFGSPALLDRVGRFGVEAGVTLPSVRRVISAGAPVSTAVLERFVSLVSNDAHVYTPYGATEALPVASIDARDILTETRKKTEAGGGICVGKPVKGVHVDIIRIVDDAIPTWADSLRLSPFEIGEIVVSGPNVTQTYLNRDAATRLAKIEGRGGKFFHRMGDVGYLDADGRVWYCGRKSQRVATTEGILFTDKVENIFNTHPDVYRSALVGVKQASGSLLAVLCVELEASGRKRPRPELKAELLAIGAKFPPTARIQTILFHDKFPVDIRHNAKIFREKLATWAAKEVK